MKAQIFRNAEGELVKVQRTPDGVVVYHPDGRVETITTGRL